MKLVVAQIQGGIDGLEGLEVDVDLPLLALGGDNFTAVNDQPIGWDFIV